MEHDIYFINVIKLQNVFFCIFQLTIELYEMLENVDSSNEHMRFMDPISDFLYPFAKLYRFYKQNYILTKSFDVVK